MASSQTSLGARWTADDKQNYEEKRRHSGEEEIEKTKHSMNDSNFVVDDQLER